MSSPAIVLLSKFTIGTTFEGYISYMERGEAKQATDSKLSEEAQSLVHQEVFQSLASQQDTTSFERYVDYMSRKQALTKKEKLTSEETVQADYLDAKLSELLPESHQPKLENSPLLLHTGLFHNHSDDLMEWEAKNLQAAFKQAGQKGNVLYQDVFSFDTHELVSLGLYNPHTNELTRQPLIEATRRAMGTLFEKEQLGRTGFWVGEIHYNTQHFHIHVATTELQNSRPLKQVELGDGTVIHQPRGVRKEASLHSMKTSFMNALVDRSAELERLSTLRNNVVHFMREHVTVDPQYQAIVQLRNELGTSKRNWTYKRLSTDQRQVVDTLVHHYYLGDQPDFQAYRKLVTEEGKFRQGLYTKENSKNEYATNQLQDLQKRMGNALLKNIRSMSDPMENPPVPQEKKSEESSVSNLHRFTAYQQEQLVQRDPLATNLRTREEWQSLGRGVPKEAPSLSMLYPIRQPDETTIRGFGRQTFYDVRVTTVLSDGDLNRSSFSPNTYQAKRYRQSVAKDVHHQLKQSLTNEWERTQQLREHERLERTIAYKRQAIEEGYDW